MTQITNSLDIDIGIGVDEADRTAITDGLSRLLADTYTLYLKTHNYHWNVAGPMFASLHLTFEAQYTGLALAVDLIAERIRSLGHQRPGATESSRCSRRYRRTTIGPTRPR